MIDLSTYNKQNYDPGPLPRRIAWYVVSLLFFETRLPWPYSLKRTLLSLFGCTLRDGLIIKPKVKIKYPWFLDIGAHCWIGEGVWIDNLCQVTLGDHVVLSQGAYLVTGNHDHKKESFDLILAPIEVQSGAWITAKSIVCPGVTIGENSILTCGSVATHSLAANHTYSGNPATPKT
ncbi:MAG: WcaF family extracellular polysaccharide biosynthesis acetyltransferase [Verrucomicrobiales bacterium]|nr:WcaF family extracellular polysaccharide biosynthesis acetyltransferase [Verrucomicrobiales bacterium]